MARIERMPQQFNTAQERVAALCYMKVTVVELFKVDKDFLTNRKKTAPNPIARYVIYYYLVRVYGYSLRDIAEVYNLDHKSVDRGVYAIHTLLFDIENAWPVHKVYAPQVLKCYEVMVEICEKPEIIRVIMHRLNKNSAAKLKETIDKLTLAYKMRMMYDALAGEVEAIEK